MPQSPFVEEEGKNARSPASVDGREQRCYPCRRSLPPRTNVLFFRDGKPPRDYMRAMTTAIQTIRDDFSLLDEWEDRYRYVIELGESLPPFPDAGRTAANKVPGCVSQVWLTTEHGPEADPVITFEGDSDAHIVRGLVAIMLALFSGHSASEILKTDAEATLKALGLDEHLSPQRANGLRSMVKRIKRDAEEALKQTA